MSGAADAAAGFLCGVVSGIVGKAIDYPLDTVKTRLQAPGAESKYKGAVDCVRITLRNEGVKGFYRGIAAPIIGSASEKAFIFSAFTVGKDVYHGIEHALHLSSATDAVDPEHDSIAAVAFGGFFSGIFTGIVNTPPELIKCRVQVFPGRFKGSFDCARDIVHSEGASALFKGISACWVREMYGNMCYFGAYEYAVRSYLGPTGHKKDAPWWLFPTAGALAGATFWLLAYPVDTVKTQMQVNESLRLRGMSYTARHVYAIGGMSGFFRGLNVTIIRSFPSSAGVFTTYEALFGRWRRYRTSATREDNKKGADVPQLHAHSS